MADLLAQASGDRHFTDADAMYNRFMQVTVWSRKVLELRARLAGTTLSDQDKDPDKKAENIVVTKAKEAVQKYKERKEQQAVRQQLLDKPIGATHVAPPPRSGTAAVAVHPKAAPVVKSGKLPVNTMKLPKLKAEPWLENLLDSSRFF